MMCDGVSDCPNGEDERDCPPDSFLCLAPGYGLKFLCFIIICCFEFDIVAQSFIIFCRENRTQEKVPLSSVCNGGNECSNGADESQCTWISEKLPMAVNSFG